MNRPFAALTHGLISFASRRVLRPITRNMTYTIRHGFARGMKTRGGLDFVPRPSSREVAFLSGLSLRGKIVFDVGGFDGVHTLGFSRAVGPTGRVLTFEPNPDQAEKIERDLDLNNLSNVEVLRIALGREKAIQSLVVPVAEPSMASMDHEVQQRVSTMGDSLRHEIEVESVDDLIAQARIPKPDFVKIDVEGSECEVLRGMINTIRDARPTLFIEIHAAEDGDESRFARETIELLTENGYRVDLVEQSCPISLENADRAIQRHVYCSSTDSET